MSAICRLANRNLFSQIVYSRQPGFLPLARHVVTIKVVPVKQSKELDHDEHNAQLGRPQSPYWSVIYTLKLTSLLSISHRMTGAILGGYTVLLGTGALVLPHPISYYIDALQELHPSSATLFVMKFLLAFPFSYHFCNGIRHLSWDMGKNLTLKGVYKTGYIMLASTTVLTILFSVM